MASTQELESKVGILERKVAFLLSLVNVTKRTPSTLMAGEFIEERLSGEQLYREVSNAGQTGLKEVSDV